MKFTKDLHANDYHVPPLYEFGETWEGFRKRYKWGKGILVGRVSEGKWGKVIWKEGIGL